MTEQELVKLIEKIQHQKCEGQTIEVKTAHQDCPERLYDTLSAFSNQDDGGTIVFGLDESKGFLPVGVYDPQDLQKKVMEYGEQMTPLVRPLFTVCAINNDLFVSAEIPPLDAIDRPCFKTAKGRIKGSYTRVGDADKPMTEYKVYSYEAFRKKCKDDLRPVEDAAIDTLDQSKLAQYVLQRKLSRPNFSALPDAQIYALTGVTNQGKVTLSAELLFGFYPQAFFPQLSVIATSTMGTEMGNIDENGQRFTDSKRIEGTLPDMLDGALSFVRSNTKIATRIDPVTGQRTDVPQYPMDAVREVILNALLHRDYSMHTENMPIQLRLFSNRLEVVSPGGLYGRLTLDQLGKIQPDTRNPVLVTMMEALGKTENRYSGIPRIRKAMQEMNLPEPFFEENRGEFVVRLFCDKNAATVATPLTSRTNAYLAADDPKGLLPFCRTPRTRREIIEFLNIPSTAYALRRYLEPLVKSHQISLALPDRPHSPRQKFFTTDSTM